MNAKDVVGLCAAVSIAMLVVWLATLSGCSALTKIENPVKPGYPCGTQSHACSLTPLTCCWNGEVCGKSGSSCPEGMCCYRGDDGWAASQAPRAQWSPQ